MNTREEEDMEARGESQSSSLVGLSENSGLVHRSNASSSATIADTWHENQSSTAVTTGGDDDAAARVRRRRQSFIDDVDLDPITLPESTHTLLFTEPLKSIPYFISCCIAFLTFQCLFLVLFSDELTLGNKKVKDVIPANVHGSVKAAQYTAIFIALLMEEDIPTGLYLMQRIPRPYFIEKFPELNYGDFVYSNMLRILMGYLFLVNVLLLLMKARDVLQIFFDFVALQFIQQLGDIAFKLARMSMLSTSMKEATTRRYFRTEFRRPTLGWKAKSFFFVAVYLFNLCGLLVGMIYVSVRQSRGDFQCKSITVKFREDIWREAIVGSNPEDKRVLVYSNFNGVYAQDGSMHDGRPVYTERRKFDGTEFDTTPPSFNPFNYTVVIPAKIQYCKIFRAWVFMHENISKSKRDDSDCPWLLRSETTDVYDIEEVKGPWQAWQGVIETTDVLIACNECRNEADCNLNGVCNEGGSCDCYENVEGSTFLGPRCEVVLKDNCRTIIGETQIGLFSVIDLDWAGSGQLWEAYSRPIYQYVLGSGNPTLEATNSTFFLTYTGSRWFGYYVDRVGTLIFTEEYREPTTYSVKNYHAFWDKVYDDMFIVSDPVGATGYTPVGVDFFAIGERGEQFGPFGARIPLQLDNQTGRGYFRCSDEASVDLNIANNTAPGAGGRELGGREG